MLTDRSGKPEKEDNYLAGCINSMLDIAYKGGADDNVTILMLSAFGDTEEEVTGTRTLLDEFEALRDIDLFKNLDYKELLTVMERAEIRTYNKFDVVSRTTSSSKELFVIVEGRVSALKGSRHITTFEAGSHIGEVAFLTGENPAFNLFVDKTSTFLVLKRDAFDKIVKDNPSLGIKLLWQLATALAIQTNSSIGLIK
jgi:CRP-like cAMP-binding protein